MEHSVPFEKQNCQRVISGLAYASSEGEPEARVVRENHYPLDRRQIRHV
jgi:hypothetical protein